MGLKPEFKLADFSNGKFHLHKVEVTDAMVNEEVDRLRIKGGKMSDRESVDHEDNVLNIVLEEADKSGTGVEGGVRKENSVLVKYLSSAIQKDLMGKKVGDKICFQLSKAFEADKLEMMLHDLGFEKNDKEAAKKYFNLELVKIGHVDKREMAEEFFNELFPGRDLKTENDFKDALKQEIEKYWEGQSRNQLHDQIYHFLLDETKMEFPEAFLKRWLQVGTEKEKTADEAEREYPAFSNQLKWTLISDRVLTENKLDVSDAELRQHMKHEVMGYFGQSMGGQEMEWLDSYVERMMKDEKQVDATYRRLITEKMFKWAEEQVKPKTKTVTPDELNAMQHHHH
jgi:trigger factor